MIISASRRTDIPAYYSDWLLGKIREGSVSVKNPMNYSQVRNVNLSPEAVDCIVFWSKNPEPMLGKLKELKDYTYYFQFSLNPYDEDIEKNLPRKTVLVETFKRLSEITGQKRIIWRYDPVLINNKYTIQYHVEKFYYLACELKAYTNKVTFSFMDFYKKIARQIKENNIIDTTNEEKRILAENFSRSARENNLIIESCAEEIDLAEYDINHARCIDDRLIAEIRGNDFTAAKDKNQRAPCGCAASVDIGEYNTCLNACVYCYANHGKIVSIE